MEVRRRKGPADYGLDTEGLEMEPVYKGVVKDLHGPPPAPSAPPPPPAPRSRVQVEERDEGVFVIKGVFDP